MFLINVIVFILLINCIIFIIGFWVSFIYFYIFFCGDDGLTLPVLAAGGVGLISVASNAAPALVNQMVDAALANDWPVARRIQRQTARFVREIFSEPSPGPIKAVLTAMGKIDGDTLRLPMTPVTFPTRRRLESTAGELGLLVNAPQTGENLRMF